MGIPRIAPAFIWWFLILLGMTTLGVLTFNEVAFSAWPVLPRPVLVGIWWLAVVLHVLEAGIAFTLAAQSRHRLAWTLQTFLLGYPSLRLLRRALKTRGNVVWITGASSGIGEALAKAYAARGAKLVLSARRRDELERVASTCAPAECLVLPLDMLETGSFEAAVGDVLKRFSRLDVMVHNAGISSRSLVKDTELHVHKRIMDVNYFGVVALTRAVLKTKARFIVVSSVTGKIGSPMRSAYAASKHALHGFFDALRSEGIAVTLACPGYVRTEITLKALTGDGGLHNKSDTQVARGAAPEKVADQIIAASESGRSELYVGDLSKEWLALWLKRLVPGVLEPILRGQVPK
jgi:dehydrogenase/reductase SDR family protein 7B